MKSRRFTAGSPVLPTERIHTSIRKEALCITAKFAGRLSAFGSGPTKLTVSTTNPVIPQLPTSERTSIGAALCQSTKSLRDSPLRCAARPRAQ